MQTDISQTTTTSMNSSVTNYSVPQKTTDGGFGNDENRWDNPNASKYYGYYYNVGEYRAAIESFAIRVLGWGYETLNTHDKNVLNLITGNGKETFWNILYNHLCTKKFNGDAYAEIIWNDPKVRDFPINLKPLDPKRMTHITNKGGRLIRFEYSQGQGEIKKLDIKDVFHSMNNRVLDEPHGTSVTSAVEWVIETMQESARDYRRINHRAMVRILYIEEDDKTKLSNMQRDYADAINKGELLILPVKVGEAQFQDLVVPPAEAFVRYQAWLENKFYSQLGISKVSIGGTTENNTEASAKVNMVITEPVWIKEITELEQDVLNQLKVEIKINRQPSLMDNMQADEAKNTGQTKLQYQGAQ